MRVILFVLFSLLCSTLFSQVDTLYYDKDFKSLPSKYSCDYWRVVDYNNKTFIDYHSTGEIRIKGNFLYIDKDFDLESIFDGMCYEYYKTGSLEGCYMFKDGSFNGECVLYYPDGSVKEIGVYKDWEKNGLFTVYKEPSGLPSFEFYIDDERCDSFSEPYRVMMALKGKRFNSECLINDNSINSQKEYSRFDKYIRYFNPTKKRLGENEVGDASEFWDALLFTNPNYQKFHSKESSEKVLSKVQAFKVDAASGSGFYNNHPKLFYGFADSLLYDDFIQFFQGFNPIKPIKSIRIDGSNVKNAFVFPDGTVCITSSLFYSLNPEELLGVLAHEMAHYVLDHALVSHFKVEKRKNVNRVAALVLSSANVIAHASIQANGGVNKEDSDEYWDNVQAQTDLFFDSFDTMSEHFKYRYSREQEMEADVVAYRFLQYMGYDPRHYINALGKIMGFNFKNLSFEEIEDLYRNNKEKDKYSSHPSVLERCMMLEYIGLYDKIISR